jgi:hypothetical protein
MDIKIKHFSYKSPTAMARRVFSDGLRTDNIYLLSSEETQNQPIVEIDTTAPVGPATGKSVWTVQINPHPWSQIIAEYIWEHLDDDEVTENSLEPYGVDCCMVGWFCEIKVQTYIT